MRRSYCWWYKYRRRPSKMAGAELLLVLSVVLLIVSVPGEARTRGESDPTRTANGTDLDTVRLRLLQFYLDNGDCTQNDPTFCASGGCEVACPTAIASVCRRLFLSE